MADAGSPLSDLRFTAAKHIQSLEAKLGELAERPDPETAQKAHKLRKLLAEVRGALG